MQPLGALYFGEPITDGEAQVALEAASNRKLRFDGSAISSASRRKKLAEGKIVARAKGAVEFGARALGNPLHFSSRRLPDGGTRHQ